MRNPMKKPVAISIFSGAGGLDLGFRYAGFEIPVAVDVDKDACDTYAANFGGTVVRPHDGCGGKGPSVICADIATLSGTELRKSILKQGGREDIDMLLGGPSCQSWSTAGKMKGLADDRGRLILQYLRILGEIRPRAFLFENVRGIVSRRFLPVFRDLVVRFEQLGYDVSYRLVNSWHYGVPQIRERVIVIGTRRGTTEPYRFPDPIGERLSLADAIADLPPPASDGRCDISYNEAGSDDSTRQRLRLFARHGDAPCVFCTLTGHRYQPYTPTKKRLLDMIGEGQDWRQLPADMAESYMGRAYRSGGGRTGFLRRLSFAKPSPTILTSVTQKATDFCYPTGEARPLTVRECARIQTFPDWFTFSGSMASQYRQVGNAVPPLMAYVLATSFHF